MKTRCILLLFTFFCFSCEKENVFESETNERFAIIQNEINSMPNVQVNFYQELAVRGPLTASPLTSCLTKEVSFEKPYIIANGMKFHAYYWTRTENDLDYFNQTVNSIKIAFDKEK